MNIGIIGAGNIARKMAYAIQQTEGATFYGVGSRNLSKAEAFAKEHGALHAFGSYEALVEDENIDLVYIATPHSHHYAHAKLALLHDKHVLCEKAFVVNRQQLEELVMISQERQLTLIEAIWTRFLPLNRQLKAWLDQGRIGELHYLQANLSYPIAHVERMHKLELAGGALLDLGVYTVHFALAMFGNAVETIQSAMNFYPTGVDSQEATTIHFKGGQMAQITSSMVYQSDNRATIYGSQGYIEVDNVNHAEAIRLFDSEGKLVDEEVRPQDHGGFEFQLAESLQMIREGRIESAIVTHEDSLQVMSVMDEIRRQNKFRYPFE